MVHKRNFLKVSVCSILAAALYFSFSFKLSVPDLPAGAKATVWQAGPVRISSFGKQPTLTVDKNNNLHVVFGQGKEIFYTISKDNGSTFSTPEKVGEQDKLALGATRGPQIISTDNYIVIAAADHRGAIMAYRLRHGESQWSRPVNILKRDSTAKEGFVVLAAGKQDHVYAAWLDLRLGKQNNIFSSYSTDGGKAWSENKLVYAAPGGGVCPCCRPSITADKKGNVYVMFRNELDGARDLYLARSKDSGKTFAPAQKLGTGTWMLKQCPMDGGAVSIGPKGNVGTTWRRENAVYYAEPGKTEIKIGEGRASVLVKNSRGNYLAWQQENQIMVLTPDKLTAQTIGTGIYPRLAALKDESVMCIWESDGQILATKLSWILR